MSRDMTEKKKSEPPVTEGPDHSPSREDLKRSQSDRLLVWYEVKLNLQQQQAYSAIPPRDATWLLSGHNPPADDGITRPVAAFDIHTSEMSTADMHALFREFRAEAHEGDRTLAYWIAIAIQKGLKVHPWVNAWAVEHGELIAAATTSAGADISMQPEQPPEPDGLTRRETQIKAILGAIKERGLKPMSVPDGGKAAIKRALAAHHPFGSEKAFDNAWSEASKAKRLSIRDKKRFT